jgi:CPA2 family monovalent cation:H+ antiporter-2
VVLMRVLEDRQILTTSHGHVAVGWLVVEDLLTVIVLVVIPALAGAVGPTSGAPGSAAFARLLPAIGIAVLKLGALTAIVLLAGSRVIPRLLELVAHLRSRELFTLTVLAVAMVVATGSAFLFGASMALGAFLAGMVVGQSPVGRQAAADALPLRDAFAVLFFVSVGMLMDPGFLLEQPGLVLATLGIVLVGKPLAALAIVMVLGYSVRTALVVALGLGQVGEFSFIVGELARQHGLLPPAGQSALVACALLSIAINPALFGLVDPLERWLRGHPRLWARLNARAEKQPRPREAGAGEAADVTPLAIIVGFGPVGQAVDQILREASIDTVVIDMNIDTVNAITRDGRRALFGDASHRDVLEHAGMRRASYLVVTLPHSLNRGPLVAAARQLNPDCRVVVRARYIREAAELAQVGAHVVCFEEVEAAVALARELFYDLGTDPERAEAGVDRIRTSILASQ